MSMSRADLIYRNLWVVVGWALVVTVVYLSLVPSPPPIPGRFGDKGGHVLAYALLMFWFACLYADRARRRAAVGLAVMGLVLDRILTLRRLLTVETIPGDRHPGSNAANFPTGIAACRPMPRNLEGQLTSTS